MTLSYSTVAMSSEFLTLTVVLSPNWKVCLHDTRSYVSCHVTL